MFLTDTNHNNDFSRNGIFHKILDLLHKALRENAIPLALLTYHDNDIASVLPELTPEERRQVRDLLGTDRFSEIFAYTDDADEYIRMSDIQQFHRINEQSELVIIPGISHRFQEDGAWDMVLDLTRDWFEFEQVLLM